MKLIKTTALLTFRKSPSSGMGLLHLMLEPELIPVEGISKDLVARILNSVAVTLGDSAETFKNKSKNEADKRMVNLINDAMARTYEKALHFAQNKSTKSLIQFNQAVHIIDNEPNKAEPLLLQRLKVLEENYGNRSERLESVLTALTQMYASRLNKENQVSMPKDLCNVRKTELSKS